MGDMRGMVIGAVLCGCTVVCACAGYERWPGPPPHNGKFVLTGRVVSERTVTEVIYGGIDVTLIEEPAYTLQAAENPDGHVEFLLGPGAACPVPFPKDRVYRVTMHVEGRPFAIMGGEPDKDWPDLVATACESIDRVE